MAASIFVNGKEFMAIQESLYTNRSGETVRLITYETNCVDCGAPFQVVVSERANPEKAAQFKRLRCDLHKPSFDDLQKRWAATNKERWAAIRRGDLPKPQQPHRKVTDAQVSEIRAYAAQGFTAADLVLVFPLAEVTIRSIIKGRRR